ncbi:MAG TPA: TetR/AcrR family transcriptional regulator [Candidatus Blautia pullicola]|uniref:TetR/AcrR family transcriptional regulator n=1 Tax=Candidatus Blautia pullicola TaxID=2838498 RepID=A0A9D2FRF7_9FIRM|nr:TetR/AcrR family transcriptional regulator [Candidatus Blautia pullicola]
MYEGKNPIAIQSKQWLAQALTELMYTKKYTTITILDICKKADLSRQTFYNLFQSKEDILRFYLEQAYEKEFHRLQNMSCITMKSILDCFTHVLKNNHQLLKLMVANNLENIITSEIAKCIQLYANKFSVQSPKDTTFVYGVSFLSGALAETIFCWFKQEDSISPEELTSLLLRILSGNYYHIAAPEGKQ